MTETNIFPGFCQVRLIDKPIFTEHLHKMLFPPRLITYTFTNFYIWNHWDHFYWRLQNDALCLIADYPIGTALLPPIAPDQESFIRAMEYMMERFRSWGRPLWFTELDSRICEMIQQTWPDRFLKEEYRPGGNYVYYQQDLASLKGKKYNGKRNHLNHFQKNNPDWQLSPITTELATRCRQQFHKWNDLLHPDDPELALEAVGVEQALEHLEELGLSSAALLLHGEPIAFTFGEALNADTFCIHVEKADSRIRGAYQAINQLFAEKYCQGYTYINRAEDMGDPGQQKAKESYHPCHLERKYVLREKQ